MTIDIVFVPRGISAQCHLTAYHSTQQDALNDYLNTGNPNIATVKGLDYNISQMKQKLVKNWHLHVSV
jgi:hypothetical protein